MYLTHATAMYIKTRADEAVLTSRLNTERFLKQAQSFGSATVPCSLFQCEDKIQHTLLAGVGDAPQSFLWTILTSNEVYVQDDGYIADSVRHETWKQIF